jgi:malonyl CoA-acyl carrier protein transacylase
MLVPGVEFAVLGCPVERATQEIAAHPDVVVSHENSTHQTVVCGPADQIGALVDRMRAQAVICQLLPFRSGFHTPMLAPYLPPFLESGVPSLPVRTAATPVWSATTASPFPHDPAAVRDLAVRHLLEPVRFRALALALHDSGIRVFVQVGPGQLGSLVADTLRDRDHLVVAAGSTTRPGIAQLRRVAAALWAEGGAPDLTALEPRQVEPDPVSGLGPVERLRELATRTAWAGELAALLGEVADTVTDVVRAAAPVPDPVLEVSTRAMPHLLDHCFAWQRADWPDETDRRPVMPGATVLHHLVRAAEDAHPRRRAHTVTDIRLHRWLVAAPPARVPLVARPEGAGVRVALGDYADAVIHLTGDTPAREPVWGGQPGERRPALTAQQLYRERWMFHGPAYQGITRSVAISARGIRGQITVPPAPGALLDNVGQLIGQWLVETYPDRWIALPARIDRIVFHGPPPTPGQTVDCAIRITALTQDTMTADAQVSIGDRLLVSVTGWHNRRFDSDPRTSALHRFPETSTLAEQQDGGWWLLAERWDSLASRDFYLRKYLNSAERAEHEACPPTQRRRWLLTRIAVKDAVRGWLWRHGTGPVFPAEVLVRADPSGRITATGRHGLEVPPLSVAVAVCQDLAAAAVGPADEPVGIGLVDMPGPTFDQLPELPELSEVDAGLLDRWRTATGDALPTALARLHAAQRANPRARASHPADNTPPGQADDTPIGPAAEDPAALVTASGARIRTDLLTSPQGLPPRRYAVAWRLGSTPAPPTPAPPTLALTAAHREDTP